MNSCSQVWSDLFAVVLTGRIEVNNFRVEGRTRATGTVETGVSGGFIPNPRPSVRDTI